MGIALWRVKRLWMYPFMLTKPGEDLYEWLTAVALGTQHGMSRKWCYWFREHAVLSRRFGGASFAGKRLWLFEPGWSLAPMILGAMTTGTGPLVTERSRHLARRYVRLAIEQAGMVAGQACKATGASPACASSLDRLSGAGTPEGVLAACGAEYRVGGIRSLSAIPESSFDICMSMGRLEHFSEVELGEVFGAMYRAMRPGAVGSHIVDHRDHYWHFDKSIHCFHHLTFSDERWNKTMRGRRSYRNRLLEHDYVRLFEAAGFQVTGRVHELHKHDADGVDPGTLWGPFASISPDDLSAAVTHFIVRRP